MCLLQSDTSLGKTGGIIYTLHHPALQGNKPLSFAAWLYFLKNWGVGGRERNQKNSIREENTSKNALGLSLGKKKSPHFHLR